MSIFNKRTTQIPDATQALPDRTEPIAVTGRHFVLDADYVPPFPDGTEMAVFGMGCFWGAERVFWRIPGVVTTAVGYAGGSTAHPTYADVCSGRTGHTEAVLVVYDPDQVTYEELLREFWERHDPTQGMRQGNDRGTQYRSAIYWFGDKQQLQAEASRDRFQQSLRAAGMGTITTEIAEAGTFFYAEEYHQQYLAKNFAASPAAPTDLAEWYLNEAPGKALAVEGYCSMEPTGVACPTGLGIESDPS